MATTKAAPKKAPEKATTAAKPAKKAAKPASGAISIVETGGKQYVVSEGQKVRIEIMPGAFKEGDKITFDKVLLSHEGTNTTVGTPYISGAKVEGEITKVGRAQKVIVIKYKAKSRYFKKRGHRQPFFDVKVTKVA
jgi:large subunit ribosomal protein L21